MASIQLAPHDVEQVRQALTDYAELLRALEQQYLMRQPGVAALMRHKRNTVVRLPAFFRNQFQKEAV